LERKRKKVKKKTVEHTETTKKKKKERKERISRPKVYVCVECPQQSILMRINKRENQFS
jgi:deoxyadenosine/deoxycytidine kinase